MNDSELDEIYKRHLPTSHAAGLRAVFDAGYSAGQSPAKLTKAEKASAKAEKDDPV